MAEIIHLAGEAADSFLVVGFARDGDDKVVDAGLYHRLQTLPYHLRHTDNGALRVIVEAACKTGDTIPALVFDLGEAETLLDEA